MRKLTALWPFLWLLLVWIYVVVPFSSASGMDLGKSNQIFSALLLFHAGLYALNCFQLFPRRWFWLYVVLQDGFIVSMSLVLSPANTFIVSIGLYLALIGESISLRREHAVVTLTVASAVVSFLVSITVRGGWEALHHAILYVAPVMLVAVGYIALSFRLARANGQSQSLLRELEEAHATLACYADRVKDLTLAHERERLARELHDTLAQGLAGLTMQLDAADALLSEDNPEEAQTIIQQAMVRSRATLADARSAIDDLRGQDAEALDGSRAVQQEIVHFTTATGIVCHTDLTALTTVVPPFHEHVLRVLTEGLLNVARHARANQVWIRTMHQQGLFTLEIRDDGVGFDPLHESRGPGHYGLLGLRERARLIGGCLEIESVGGSGTTIRLTFPYAGEGRQHTLEGGEQGRAHLRQRNIHDA
jgi:two-component system, NarL family, sensor histidine kinase YdfH